MSTEYQPLATNSSSISSSSSWTSMSSKYSKAIFTEIPDFYDVIGGQSVVECRLYYSIDIIDDDIIGLVRVGDKDRPLVVKALKDCPLVDKEGFGERFVSLMIAKEVLDQISDEEFFQFSYLRNSESETEVFGASVPFRFRKSVKSSDEEEDDDFLVVRSPEAVLKEEIGKLVEMTANLENGNRSLERRLAETEMELLAAKKSRDEMEVLFSEEKRSLETVIEGMKERTGSLEMSLAEVKRERDSKEEEMERKGREGTQREASLERKILDQKNIIDEISGKMSLTEAKEEFLRTRLAEELSLKRDLEEDNRRMREESEEWMKKKAEVEEKNEILLQEVIEMDKTRLKVKVQMKTMREEMDQMESEYKKKEEEYEEKMTEMRGRLESAAEEYRKVFRMNEKLMESKDRLKTKVKRYVEKKNQLIPELEDNEEVNQRNDDNLQSVLPCVVCSDQLEGRPALVQHLEDKHAQRLCPVCSLPFDTRVSGHEQYFRMHVENHLEGGYPH